MNSGLHLDIRRILIDQFQRLIGVFHPKTGNNDIYDGNQKYKNEDNII